MVIDLLVIAGMAIGILFVIGAIVCYKLGIGDRDKCLVPPPKK